MILEEWLEEYLLEITHFVNKMEWYDILAGRGLFCRQLLVYHELCINLCSCLAELLWMYRHCCLKVASAVLPSVNILQNLAIEVKNVDKTTRRHLLSCRGLDFNLAHYLQETEEVLSGTQLRDIFSLQCFEQYNTVLIRNTRAPFWVLLIW